MQYGANLIQNFNGTGYRFLKREKFIGIRYDLQRPSINYWTFYAYNMENAY